MLGISQKWWMCSRMCSWSAGGTQPQCPQRKYRKSALDTCYFFLSVWYTNIILFVLSIIACIWFFNNIFNLYSSVLFVMLEDFRFVNAMDIHSVSVVAAPWEGVVLRFGFVGDVPLAAQTHTHNQFLRFCHKHTPNFEIFQCFQSKFLKIWSIGPMSRDFFMKNGTHV